MDFDEMSMQKLVVMDYPKSLCHELGSLTSLLYSLILLVLSTINCHGKRQTLVQLSSSGA